MSLVLLLALAVLPANAQDSFSPRYIDLQGIYDEISQATLQCQSEIDIDQFHQVFYTPDWVFIDAKGQRFAWPHIREQAVQALTAPPVDSMNGLIQKLSFASNGATAVVNVTTVRTIVDDEGRYGKKGMTHTLTESTIFRDTWVMISDKWKMNSREQIGQPKVWVDKPDDES